MSNADLIRVKYFHSVEIFENASDWLFYISAVLSIAVLFLESDNGFFREMAVIAFSILVIVLFVITLFLRLYLIPRASNKRNLNFFTKAFNVPLTHERVEGYYNNDFIDPIKRLAAQVFENSHFSKSIALHMAIRERTKVGLYILIWLICLINRKTEIDIVLAVTQVVFSEQIFSKFIRLEWLRMNCERVYEKMYSLFQSKPSKNEFAAITISMVTMYEAIKSNAGITFNSKLFDKLNHDLSLEWEQIKNTLRF